MTIKAIGFDYFGTLVEAKAEGSICIDSMCDCLKSQGYNFSKTDFITHYQTATKLHRTTRNIELREISNSIWISDTLNMMGYNTKPDDTQILSVVESYFNPWKLELIKDADKLLELLSKKYTLTLISNFTDSNFLNKTLSLLNINKYFKHVIVSDAFGWRKPHPNIFKQFLKLTAATPDEAIFVGDDLLADIKGAKELGIKTVHFSPQDFNKKNDGAIISDYTIHSLIELPQLLI
ncbi:HAD family hydrolase [Candidatus Bathyarchaeota archaeon]|nr:HAD family hydrolase [Candidatus Bathyarchaeota archaeon]